MPLTSPDADPLPASIRDDFPVLGRSIDGVRLTYLDSAATSLKPRAVIDEVSRYYTDVGASIHRGKHMLSEEASDQYERVRQATAAFLGCRPSEVVFVANTTHALNLLALGLGLSRDDIVICARDAHHSQLLPWRAVARVELVELDATGAVDLDHYRHLLRRRPRVVALTHCSNVTGLLTPVARMASMARDAGALSVLDAAQSAPHRQLRPHRLGVDFMAFSGHKMLGPTGIGVLFVSDGQTERLRPAELGGGTVDWVGADGHELRRPPHRFEAGTPNIAGVYGLGAALAYLQRLGMAAVEQHDLLMAHALRAEVSRRSYLRLVGTSSGERSGIASLAIPGHDDLSDVAHVLSDAHGVMCRTGHLCAQPMVDRFTAGQVLRVSAYVYNTVPEVRAAFDALDATCASLGVDVERAPED